MRKINILVILISVLGFAYLSSCKKSSSDPSTGDLLKRSWKTSIVIATQGNDSTSIYNAKNSTGNTDDFSKYSLKFDGTNYTYIDINGTSTTGTYVLGPNSKSIIFTKGALDTQVFNIVSISSTSLVISFIDNRGAKPSRQLKITMSPA